MSKFTFLTYEQTLDYEQLDILKKYGTRCAITDFSILLGGDVQVHFNKGKTKKISTCYWWTKSTADDDDAVVAIDKVGEDFYINSFERSSGARPTISYSLISNYSTNKKRNKKGILEVEYGEYPQTVVPEVSSKILEKAFANMSYSNTGMKETGKSYTTDSVSCQDRDIPFQARTHTEYEYKGRKYIRFVADSNCEGEVLSDGRMIRYGNPYWVRVEPIKWMIDEKEDIAISKKLIFSGVQFNRISNYRVDFNKTDIKEFMDKYFSKDIMPSITKEDKEKNPFINSYGFNFRKVSEEDIIKGAIESNISVFLHGRSSEGKSARVKQIDPDCVIIYLRNATPESLNGKSVYNSETGEMIDIKPTWLKKLEDVCEKEPDKNHIVFFDEMTNALPSIQGIAFNIVLDKEVNGIWKLPDNARIVAAGNEMNDSLAANRLAEPLFNRFAHVYIETTVEKWLEWASKNNIHPAIYAYISYRKNEALRSKYNGETPNADPRKWEMASNMLYKTGEPEMLRALLGQDITDEFIWFCKQKVITLEDVLNDNYSEKDLKLNTGEKYMTVVGLLNVKEEDYPKVLEFLKILGNEFISIFNSLWSKDNEERLEIIAESKQDIKKKIRKI